MKEICLSACRFEKKALVFTFGALFVSSLAFFWIQGTLSLIITAPLLFALRLFLFQEGKIWLIPASGGVFLALWVLTLLSSLLTQIPFVGFLFGFLPFLFSFVTLLAVIGTVGVLYFFDIRLPRVEELPLFAIAIAPTLVVGLLIAIAAHLATPFTSFMVTILVAALLTVPVLYFFNLSASSRATSA